MTLRLALVLVVLAALDAGCGDDRRASGDGPAVWTVEPAGEIGSIAGDDALADVLFVIVGPASRVYVTQWQVPHVAVFDSTGRPLGRIGRAGMGPGEFSPQPGRMGWKGDTLWVSGGQVLDRRARHVADVWLPTDLEVHYADERQLWGEVTDSLDVPYLRRYVVRRD